MAIIKLGLKDRTIPEKIQFARQIMAALTGNAAFTNPIPPLPTVTGAVNALETGYNEAQSARLAAQAKTQEQAALSDALDKTLTQLAAWVESASAGDEAKIRSAGLELRSAPSSVGLLAAPSDLSATHGDMEGEIDLAWNRVKGAGSYLVETSLDAVKWTAAGVSTKSSYTVKNTTVGVRLWFRVAAVGSAGQGPWSDVAAR